MPSSAPSDPADFTDSNLQDIVNQQVYHRPGVEREYRERTLKVVEATVLLKYQPAFAGRNVLDIGVGTGRTAAFLAPLARRYEAVDYSPVMVDYLRFARPHLAVRLADMRHLNEFSDDSVDFALMADNVIDAVGHVDRRITLCETRRVLRPQGLLVFSSHNRRYHHALSGPRLELSRNAITQVSHIARWLRRVANHHRVGKLRSIHEDYALLNDIGHDFACLHYYVDPAVQRQQLADLGSTR